MQDAGRAYMELVLGLTEASKKKATKVAKRLIGKGGATAEQLQVLAEEMVKASTSNRDALTKLVRYELDRALGVVGLATSEEVDKLNARVRELEQQLHEAEARGGPGGSAAAEEKTAVDAVAVPRSAKATRSAGKSTRSAGKATTAAGKATRAAENKAAATKAAVTKAAANKADVKRTMAKKAVAKKTAGKALPELTPGPVEPPPVEAGAVQAAPAGMPVGAEGVREPTIDPVARAAAVSPPAKKAAAKKAAAKQQAAVKKAVVKKAVAKKVAVKKAPAKKAPRLP
jgi:polyhydroxyalkanoate synthesis regulator phasin